MGLLNNFLNSVNAAAKAVSKQSETKFESAAAPIDCVPDTPIPFGYKISWLCVKADSSEEVIEKLGLKNAVKCSWKYAYKHLIEGSFVSPPLDGFVLVIGWGADFLEFDPEKPDKVGAAFPEVQYFASHRVTSYAAWVKYSAGKRIRAYCWCGASGEVLINEGELTDEEKACGLTNLMPYSSEEFDKYDTPNELDVVKLAAAWGINTLELDKYPASTGYFCKP